MDKNYVMQEKYEKYEIIKNSTTITTIHIFDNIAFEKN